MRISPCLWTDCPIYCKGISWDISHGVWKGNKIIPSYIPVKKVCRNRLIVRNSTNFLFSCLKIVESNRNKDVVPKNTNIITPAWDSWASSEIWVQTLLTILLKKFSNMFLKNSNVSAITVFIQITKRKYQNVKRKVWQSCWARWKHKKS